MGNGDGWWHELGDSEIRSRLVHRGVDVNVAYNLVSHMRRGCSSCARHIAKVIEH